MVGQAAAQGHANAQNNLGRMCADGRGVPQNYAEAVKWYRKAAEQGFAPARYNLGVMYSKGERMPKDYVSAHIWFNLAAAQGHEDAQRSRDILAKRMTLVQIAEAQRMAGEWMAKHQQ